MHNESTRKEMNKLPKIVAVDFDGTLVKDNFPFIGEVIPEMFEICNILKQSGVKLILWTSRDGENLKEAIDFCEDRGLVFDAVNENIPEVQALFNNDTRKVYADVYIDDKCIPMSCTAYDVACALGMTWATGIKEGKIFNKFEERH